MDKTRIRREGDLAIRLKNIDDGEKSLQARLLLPDSNRQRRYPGERGWS